MTEAVELLSRLPNSTATAITRLLQASQSPAHIVLVARTLNAMAEALPQISAREAEDAAGEASNDDVMLRFLMQPEALAALRRENPLTPAMVRGLQGREELLQAEGGVVNAREAARLLHCTRQSVDNRRRANRLIGLSLGRRGYVYPLWQFTEEGTLPGLAAVLAVLAHVTPWMQAHFMLTGDARLGEHTPLEELRVGRLDSVMRAAEGFGEHGAA